MSNIVLYHNGPSTCSQETVDDHNPEPLLGILNKFGSDLKEDVIQITKS